MRIVFLYFVVCIGFFSCKKVLFEEEPTNDPVSVFNQVWDYTNENYSFFEYKNIDWDSIKTVFEPRVSNSISQDSLFRVLSDMLYTLKDGHVNLTSPFNISRNWSWYLDYPQNYNENLLKRYYFKDQQEYVGPFVIHDFGDVGYIRYGSFSSSVSDSKMQYVLEKFRDRKGLIIDVRDNGGGSISNVYNIANHFTDEKFIAGLYRVKNGPAKNDYTDFYGMQLEPIEDFVSYKKPVILLTNRMCYSATNMFRTVMGELKNVTVIGDRTGGGGGVPTYKQLSNGWQIRVSSSQTYTLNGVNNENGLLPNIKVDMTADDEAKNIDTILEEALKELRN